MPFIKQEHVHGRLDFEKGEHKVRYGHVTFIIFIINLRLSNWRCAVSNLLHKFGAQKKSLQWRYSLESIQNTDGNK